MEGQHDEERADREDEGEHGDGCNKLPDLVRPRGGVALDDRHPGRAALQRLQHRQHEAKQPDAVPQHLQAAGGVSANARCLTEVAAALCRVPIMHFSAGAAWAPGVAAR